jgi:hypothetical protein
LQAPFPVEIGAPLAPQQCVRRPGPGAKEAHMTESPQRAGDEVPLGQRLFDRPFLLLAACLVVMFVFYTGWGLLELASLGDAPLP